MIADEGTHDALIARDTIYHDFWERQTEGYRG
jgi:ABC-type multidrug transport system fused ATPase/permease subunit